jgi:hypothetical protein
MASWWHMQGFWWVCFRMVVYVMFDLGHMQGSVCSFDALKTICVSMVSKEEESAALYNGEKCGTCVYWVYSCWYGETTVVRLPTNLKTVQYYM